MPPPLLWRLQMLERFRETDERFHLRLVGTFESALERGLR
jgi:hypothetical protein